MSKWIAEFELEDGDTMPEHMDLEYKGAKIDFHCRPMWIPCSERLPEPWNLVLVTDSCKNVSVCQMALNPSDGWYDECENWMYFSTSVIAWMPLPKPYQEEGEQK